MSPMLSSRFERFVKLYEVSSYIPLRHFKLLLLAFVLKNADLIRNAKVKLVYMVNAFLRSCLEEIPLCEISGW